VVTVPKRAERRLMAPRTLGVIVPALTREALGKKAAAFGTLITEWPSIVGETLAAWASPLKLAFPRGRRDLAVLHIQVSGAAALEIQHDEPRIIERINRFFGYAAVARLKLIQAPRTPPRVRPALPPPPATAEVEAMELHLEAVESPALRQALARLGCTVRAGRR